MERTRTDRTLLYVLAATVVVFVVGRLVGAAIFANGWSFDQWQGVPGWYIIVWFVVTAAVTVLLSRYFESIARFLHSTWRLVAAGVILFAAIFVAQFNSFLYGAGNMAVARIAQTPNPIFRWFDYGSSLVVWLLFHFYSALGLQYNAAGVYAWKTLAFVATALSLVAAWKIAAALSEDPIDRLAALILTFFGPQLLLYFGFVGTAPVVVAFSLWFAWLTIRLVDRLTSRALAGLWLLLLLGVVMKATLFYLFPAAVFVTLIALMPRRDTFPVLPFLVAVVTWLIALIALYAYAAGHLEIKSALLLIAGKNPFPDYGIFSGGHLGDILQLLFLLFPLVTIAEFVAWKHARSFIADRRQLALHMIWLGGFTALFVMDPKDGIALDVPILAAYLTVSGAIVAALLTGARFGAPFRRTTLGLIGAAAIVLPLSYLPSYLNINDAERPVQAYLDGNPAYYRTGAPALRDAFFYRKDLDKANWWDQNYIRLSPDYLRLTGISEYARGGRTDEALSSLTKLIARDPYWVEPRTLYASIEMKLNRFQLARPQLDTALMLAPYDKSARINDYAWYRDTGDNFRALKAVRAAAGLFPGDSTVETDLMLLHYRNGHVDTALAMADSLLAVDSNFAYPYAVKGFVADHEGHLQEAIDDYEAFAKRAPDDPQTPDLRKRSNQLYLKLHPEK